MLTDSVVDPTRLTLDQQLFDNKEPKSELIDFLKNITNEIDTIVPITGRSLIKGSILSYQWLSYSDLDLLVEIDDIDNEQFEPIKYEIKRKFDNKQVLDTKHPLQIYLFRGKYDEDNADGIYDLNKGWVKGPYNISFNELKYQKIFDDVIKTLDIKTGELRRNLIDYNILKDLPFDEIKGIKAMISKKLNDIENNINELLYKRSKIKKDRDNVFNRTMTPYEIKEYGTKNLLPQNVILKLLERYHYMKFLNILNNLFDDELIHSEDLKELTKLLNAEPEL